MKKIRLELSDLEVQSFVADEGLANTPGTVFGRDTVATNCDPGGATCGGGLTCDGLQTCSPECWQTGENTCGDTCNCQTNAAGCTEYGATFLVSCCETFDIRC